MPKKYVLKTQSGSLYEVYDESHLFGSDYWILIKDNNKFAILGFGDIKKLVKEDFFPGKAISPKITLKVLEAEVGHSIKSKSCIGHILIYTPEDQFNNAMKLLTELKNANTTGNYDRAEEIWQSLLKIIGHSSKIIETFKA